MTSEAIALLRSHSFTTLVQQELERLILSGELAPGDRLREEELAERLNVSRGPVREAFRALGQAGLVRIEKNRGVSVRQISVDEADEIYEVRAGLDELIGRLAAQRITNEQIGRLHKLLTKMDKSAKEKNVDAYYPLNFEFHDLLASFAANGTLLSAYRRIVNELHLFRRKTLALGDNSFPISIHEHKAIVDALNKRDGKRAGRLLYQHAMESRARLHQVFNGTAAQASPNHLRRKNGR